MQIELSEVLKTTYQDAAQNLKGRARRKFMAGIAMSLGYGGHSYCAQELGWDPKTMRKGREELKGGVDFADRPSNPGRKPTEARLPTLIEDLQSILDGQSQTDATFQSQRLYTRLSVREVRAQLIAQKGYTDEALPSDDVLRQRINDLGYKLKTVKKNQPKKKIPETDAIFDQLSTVHEEAESDETVLRLSIDAKATVKVGPFSRKGKSRTIVKASDHDFKPDSKLTPFGIYLPDHGELHLYMVSSRVTSDFIVDCLDSFWDTVRSRFPQVTTLLIDSDNGPEMHSRRTQLMYRLTRFADQHQIKIQLAYYPPYHSKYNPVERVWGGLEQHWNGSLLDSVDTILAFARSFTWRAKQPVVTQVDRIYEKGVSLSQKAMAQLEQRFDRLDGLEKWFVTISPIPT